MIRRFACALLIGGNVTDAVALSGPRGLVQPAVENAKITGCRRLIPHGESRVTSAGWRRSTREGAGLPTRATIND
jgi:hypothetical protein